jgi:hypothetical protein
MKDTFLMMLDEVKALRHLLLNAEKKIRGLMRTEEFRHESDLLRSIPGMGPLTSIPKRNLRSGNCRYFPSRKKMLRYFRWNYFK